jgi:large subunit ribosomal protein L17
MRHRRKVPKLSRTESHRKAVLRNLATQLIVHEKITTTEARAKAVRPFAERLISMAREDTVHSRRTVARHIADKEAVKKLFAEISPRYRERPGGYTRIMKLARRQGDNAQLSIIELMDRKPTPAAGASEEKGTGGKKAGLKAKLAGRRARKKKDADD